MLIAIDGNEANQEKRVGVGEYGFQLLKQFYTRHETRDTKHATRNTRHVNFIVYLKEKPREELPKQTEWWQYRVVGPKFFWTQIALPLALLQAKPVSDVFFTPTHYAPRFCPCPRVISIMDLSYLYFPEMFRKRDLWKLRNWTAYSVKKAKKILTISKSTRDDIIKFYKVKAEKVVVTYPGYKKLKMKNQKLKTHIKNLKRKYGIRGDYILYVGTLQPRKNLVRLIKAFAKTKNQKPKTKNTDQKLKIGELKLVIAGKKGWMYERIFRKVRELGLEKEVIFTGFVPDKDLLLLYQGAKCLVLVSLYEGFGLPVLEAMSLGVPVIASNISSLPEIVGRAGILVDPEDVQDIAQGIKKVLSFSSAERKKMIEKGLKQAEKFSWEKCARETLAVLEEIAKE